MLDQVALSGSVRAYVREQQPNDFELVVTRKDLCRRLPAGSLVFRDDELRVVFDDVREAGRREDLLPEVVGLQPIGIRRIARSLIPAAIERQEPRRLPLQLRAETNFVIVDRKVDDAAAELEEQLVRIAVALVLLHRILDGLFRKAVLQFKRDHGQAVDEERDIERELRFVAAVPELPRNAEPVLRRTLLRFYIAG